MRCACDSPIIRAFHLLSSLANTRRENRPCRCPPTCLFSATEAISTLAREPTILFLLEKGVPGAGGLTFLLTLFADFLINLRTGRVELLLCNCAVHGVLSTTGINRHLDTS
jgi:hypothetical protein